MEYWWLWGAGAVFIAVLGLVVVVYLRRGFNGS
jgi:hypothetical protein